ncbi:hypothetical protein AB0B10_06140 [Micromonospora arborensis]
MLSVVSWTSTSRFATEPVQRRHWFNMIHLAEAPDGSLRWTF